MTVYLGNSSWQSNPTIYTHTSTGNVAGNGLTISSSGNTLTVISDEELLARIPGAKELHAYLSEKFPGLVSVEHNYNQNFIVVRGVLYSLFKKFFLDEYEKIQEKTDDNIGEYALKNVDGDYVDIWVEYRDGSSDWAIYTTEDSVSDKTFQINPNPMYGTDMTGTPLAPNKIYVGDIAPDGSSWTITTSGTGTIVTRETDDNS